jgi:hypothetical protein
MSPGRIAMPTTIADAVLGLSALRWQRRRRRLPALNPLIVCGLLPLLLLAGCGRDGPQPVPIDGTITLDGGPWPKPGVLYFTTETSSRDAPSRPAMGQFDTNGKLTVTTFTKGDGLLPGKYKMGVECWLVPPSPGGPMSQTCVPERYCSPATSGLTLTVEPSKKVVTLKLDIAKH